MADENANYFRSQQFYILTASNRLYPTLHIGMFLLG